ncbi:MAG: hypothetical protein ACN6QY_10680 [Pseudomonas sp.]|uniref:hypothetical protein n=1 Tax=unclassified Pseudomonas TaxID=196821 RepID=UPI0007312754|nr:hypothetical protein [Pseudomonas sp. L5B5]KTC31376.1 hypothetical protein AO265_11815 [Pseudomonas sp. ABAC61]UCZ82285.1 hypothetical protein LGQ10_18105 [Pseudomonas sp. L5B5]
MNEEQLLKRVNSKRNGCRGKRLASALIALTIVLLGVALAVKHGPHPAQLLTLLAAWPFFHLAFLAEDQTVEGWFELFTLLGN